MIYIKDERWILFMTKIINDRLSFNDNKPEYVKMPTMQSHGLWAKTEVLASYDDIAYDKNGVAYFARKIPTGVSALGETLFRTEKVEPLWTMSNMVPIGGCQYAMEKLFGVKADQFSIHTLYRSNDGTITNIGLDDSNGTGPSYDIPGGTASSPYNTGNFVQLFGIGTTGTAENDITVHNVDYRETSIDISRVTTDNKTLTGTMVPFRYTSTDLSDTEKEQYFGKKLDSDTGKTFYYLKKFKSAPEIKHIWRTGEENDGNEQEVDNGSLWSNNNGINVIESFTQCELIISKKDVKEWFIAQGQEDRARINTIALFTGEYVKNADGSIGDYRDVRLFSKLNIPTEYLSISKDLNLIYRVYTA